MAGDPLFPNALRLRVEQARDGAAESSSPSYLAQYRDYDGVPEFIDEFEALVGPPPPGKTRLATAGVQIALSFFQELAAAAPGGAFYPAGLEFPGAFGRTRSPRFPSAIMRAVDDHLSVDGLFEIELQSAGMPDESISIVSSAHNPTGTTWSDEMWEGVFDRADDSGSHVAVDHTYAFPGMSIGAEQRIPERACVSRLWSMSKVGLASDRVAIVETSEDVADRMRGWQRNVLIQVPKTGQFVGSRLIRQVTSDGPLTTMLQAEYEKRWRIAALGLRDLLDADRYKIARWSGGPFLFVAIPGRNHGEIDAMFARLIERGVAVCPSSVFSPGATGVPGFRIGIGAPGPTDTCEPLAPDRLADGVTAFATGLLALESRFTARVTRPP